MPDGAYPLALAVTLAVEVPVVAAGLRGGSLPRSVAVAVAVNLATHGLLWTAWPLLPGSYPGRLAAGEIAVALCEAAAYRALLGAGLRRAAAVSAIANALSTLAGLLLWRAIARAAGS